MTSSAPENWCLIGSHNHYGEETTQQVGLVEGGKTSAKKRFRFSVTGVCIGDFELLIQQAATASFDADSDYTFCGGKGK